MNNKPIYHIAPNGVKIWYLNDLKHREDGPAVECPDGKTGWWLNGCWLSFHEFIDRFNDEELKLALVLKYEGIKND